MPQDAPPPRKRRGVRRVLYSGLAVVLAVLLALATGVPQHRTAEYMLSQQLSALVTVEGLKTWGSVRANRVVIAGYAPDGGTLPPVAILEGLRADYRLLGFSDRVLRRVTIDAVHIHLDARTGEPSNFAFLTERPADPESTGIDPKWLPEDVDVAELNLAAAIRNAISTARGFTLHCEFPGSDDALIELRGDGVQTTFAGLVEGLDATSVVADMVVAVRVDGDAVLFDANTLLEQTGELSANARAELSQSWLAPGVELSAIEATLTSASLDGRVLDQFVAGLSDGTVGFDAVIAEPSHVRFDFAGGRGLPAVEGGFLVQGLRLGTAEQSLYQGDLTIGADVPGGASKGRVYLSLDEAHVINADIEGSRESGTAIVSGEDWKKEKLIALAPAVSHTAVRSLDFDRADLSGRVEWNLDGVASEGTVTRTGQHEPFASFSTRMPEQDDWSAEARLAIGAGTVDFTYSGRALDRFDSTTRFSNFGLVQALSLAAGSGFSEGMEGTISGTFTAQAQEDSEFFTYEGSATVSGFAMDPVNFETITTELQGRLNRAANRAELSHITFEVGDGITQANFADVVVNLDPFYISSNLLGGVDLTRVAQWYEMPELYGEMEIVGPIRYKDDSIVMPWTVRCTTLGYGDLVLPYRTVMQTELTMEFDMSEQRGMLQGFSMRIGDGTQFTLTPTRFLLDPIQLGRTRFDFTTDLQLAAGMGIISAAQGEAVLVGRVAFESDTLIAEWELDSELETVVFPEEIAAAQGVVLEAMGTYAGTISGSGTIAAARLTIAGGHLTNLAGDLEIAESVVTIPDLRGDVFSGRFAGRVSAELLEPGLPAEVSGRLTAFDLAQFTTEVQPPETRLTGVADATFSVRNTLEGPEDLTVHATSSQNFSLNRDMVRQILESEALSGALGIGQLERTVSRFLGEAPQRPFDSAELSLNDEGDRLRGTAVLLSEKTKDYNGLNLTIELAIDEEALLQTLQMLQESEIANVQF